MVYFQETSAGIASDSSSYYTCIDTLRIYAKPPFPLLSTGKTITGANQSELPAAGVGDGGVGVGGVGVAGCGGVGVGRLGVGGVGTAGVGVGGRTSPASPPPWFNPTPTPTPTAIPTTTRTTTTTTVQKTGIVRPHRLFFEFEGVPSLVASMSSFEACCEVCSNSVFSCSTE